MQSLHVSALNFLHNVIYCGPVGMRNGYAHCNSVFSRSEDCSPEISLLSPQMRRLYAMMLSICMFVRSLACRLCFSQCTLCPKKGSHLMCDNNFGKSGPIFKILSLFDSRENFLCINHLTCNMLLPYLVKFKNKKNVT